jgi:hypothetical protein
MVDDDRESPTLSKDRSRRPAKPARSHAQPVGRAWRASLIGLGAVVSANYVAGAARMRCSRAAFILSSAISTAVDAEEGATEEEIKSWIWVRV